MIRDNEYDITVVKGDEIIVPLPSLKQNMVKMIFITLPKSIDIAGAFTIPHPSSVVLITVSMDEKNIAGQRSRRRFEPV